MSLSYFPLLFLLLNFVSKISQELLYLETWNFVHMTSMTSCIVGKKVRTMGPGPLELFPFVVLAIKFCIFLNNFYTGFQILMKFILHIHLYALHVIWKQGLQGQVYYSYIPFLYFVILICIYFVSILWKISPELLYLETWNFVHMTSMTSCIVGKKIRAMGPGPLELFPFVVLAIKLCIYTHFQILIKFILHMHLYALQVYENRGFRARFFSVISFVIFHYFDVHLFSVKDISGNGGGRMVRRCCVSYITGASNWYRLTVGLLSL